jgi:hypothetical protein
MARQIVDLDNKLAKAKEAADAAVETAQLAADTVAEVIALMSPDETLMLKVILTLRLPPLVHAQLRELSFNARKSQHALVMEGLNLMFERRGLPPIAPDKSLNNRSPDRVAES